MNFQQMISENILNESDAKIKVDNGSKLKKMQLIVNIMSLTKFSEKFLKRWDEEELRSLFNALLVKGKIKVNQDVFGATAEENVEEAE